MTMVFPIRVVRFKSNFGVFVVLMTFYVRKLLLYCFRECFKYNFCILEIQMERTKMVLQEQNNVFIIFLPLVKTWRPQQEVGPCILNSRFVVLQVLK